MRSRTISMLIRITFICRGRYIFLLRSYFSSSFSPSCRFFCSSMRFTLIIFFLIVSYYNFDLYCTLDLNALCVSECTLIFFFFSVHIWNMENMKIWNVLYCNGICMVEIVDTHNRFINNSISVDFFLPLFLLFTFYFSMQSVVFICASYTLYYFRSFVSIISYFAGSFPLRSLLSEILLYFIIQVKKLKRKIMNIFVICRTVVFFSFA